MAVLRTQENIKKADGTYDAVHKETEAGLVLFDDNETLQQKYDAGELNGQDIYAEAVAKGYAGTEDDFFTMLAKGPWVSRSGDPGLSGGSLKFWDGTYGIAIGEVAGYPTLTLVNDNDGAIAGVPLVIANVESPQGPLNAANKKYVDDAVASAGGSDIVTYGTCSSAASTVAKVVSATGFTLKTGSEIWVKFTNANTADAPTLNVNSTGAKYIKKYGTTAPSSYMWSPGAVVGFIYDGTYWIMANGATATTSYYGVTKLNNTVSSTATGEAATANAVRQAYDKAVEAYNGLQDTNALLNASLEKIATLEIERSGRNTVEKTNIVLSPVNMLDYSCRKVFSFSYSVDIPSDAISMRLVPPPGFAFNGLYSSFKIGLYSTSTATQADGSIDQYTGSIVFSYLRHLVGTTAIFISGDEGSTTCLVPLEVA